MEYCTFAISSAYQIDKSVLKSSKEPMVNTDLLISSVLITLLIRVMPPTPIQSMPLARTILRLVELFIIVAFVPCCTAMPNILIESGKSKCFIVEAPIDTILKVDYEAPGECTLINS